MPATGDKPDEPHLLHTIGLDIGRVMRDIGRRGLWRQLSGTLRDLESFYLTEDARRQLDATPRLKRVIRRTLWLLRGLLMKLTPPRRVLLAIALFLLIFGAKHIQYGNFTLDLDFHAAGELLLILILMLELKDKLVARDELQAGRAVQLALMPQRDPVVTGWDVWMFTAPANDVGGDLVDHLPIDAGHHGVVLGDVAGKALPAALLMVKLQATLRALIPQYASLADLASAVNRILVRDGLSNRFATLVYLILAPDSPHVRLLNAGHPPPILMHGQTVVDLPIGSMALGMMSDAEFSEQSVDLAEGDALIIYSDGVTEAENDRGDFFGDERLRAAVVQGAGEPAAARGARVLQALGDFVGDAKAHDDVSLIVLRRLAPDVSTRNVH